MKQPDAIATHNATAMPAPPTDLNPRRTWPRSTIAT